MRPLAIGVVVPAFVAVVSSAFAQPSDQAATAAAQFDRGLAAMNEGNYELGCPALTESVRLDPRPGAIFTLAECEAHWGHVASADAHYADYLARFGAMTADQQRQQRGREKVAEQKRAELRAQIPQLQLRLPPNSPAGAVVKRDGLALGAPSLGVYLPVDPGSHSLVVELPDGARTEQTIKLELAARRDVLLELPAPSPPRVATTQPDSPSTPAPAPSTTPWAAYGAFGIGAVGIGVGTVGGLSALSNKSTVDQHCTGTVCDHDGKTAADAAKSGALVSTIGFAVGGVGIAAGLVLLVLRDRSSAAAAQSTLPFLVFDAHGASLGATGAF